MQVTNSSAFEEEITDKSILSVPVTKRISKNYQVANDVLTAVITELTSVQNEITELRNRSDMLQIKNEKLIDSFKLLLEDIHMKSYELNDVYSQCQSVKMQDFGITCCIQSDLEPLKAKEKSLKPVKGSVNGKELMIDNYIVEINNDVLDNMVKHEEKSAYKEEQPINNGMKQYIEKVEERQFNSKTETLEINFSKNDMLAYLAKYKIDFLKFLQCNSNNIISGGYSELVRSFSINSNTSHNENSISFNDTKRKSSTADKTQKRNRCSSNLNSSGKSRSNDMKPGVIDTGDHLQDPGLKSSLYDDLDLHDLSELKSSADVTGSVSKHNSVSKIGRERLDHGKGIQSKMSLLKSRTDNLKIKKIEQWKTQIVKSLQLEKDEHYTGSGQCGSIKKYLNKHEIFKPNELVKSKRIQENSPKSPVKLSEERSKNSPIIDQSKFQPSLPVVRYDLSISDDSSFHLDSKPDIIIKLHTTKGSTETTKVLENMPTISPTKVSRQIHDKYSKHKHKHSSKKKAKKMSKDLEDGEII